MSQRSESVMPVGRGSLANKTTTVNTYALVGNLTVHQYKTKHFVFVGATQNLLVQVLGSVDGGTTYPFTVEDNIAVNAAATVTKTYTTPYSHMRVNVKPAVADTHGTLATRWLGAGW